MKKTDRVIRLPLLVLFLTAVILSGCRKAAVPEPTAEISTLAASSEEIASVGHSDTVPDDSENLTVSGEPGLPAVTEISESIVVLPAMPAEETGMIINRVISPAGSAANTELPVVLPTAIALTDIPTATVVPASGKGDKASWVRQSPEDGTHIDAGAEFDITWYMRNTGTTTWTTDYCCRYFSNTDLTKRQGRRFNLPYNVAPDEIGECTIDAIAPTKPGTYKMAYVLSNGEDKNFYAVDITIIVD